MAKITISIVTANNRKLIEDCLRSIYETADGLEVEVYVVVNASEDDSEETIRREFPQVRIIVNRRKLGFTHNHNMVIRRAGAPYVLVLNDDTVIMKNALQKMIDYMDAEPDAAVLGCKLLNADGSLQWSSGVSGSHKIEYLKSGLLAALFPRLGRQKVTTTRPVVWVTGAAMLLRMDAIAEVGMFDENIVIYYEDGDLCLRMHKAGRRVVYYPEAEIIHYHGQTRKKHLARDTFIIYQSRMYFFRKHYGSPTLWIVKLITGIETTLRYFWTLFAFPPESEFRRELPPIYKRVLRTVLFSGDSRLQE